MPCIVSPCTVDANVLLAAAFAAMNLAAVASSGPNVTRGAPADLLPTTNLHIIFPSSIVMQS